MTVPSDLHTPHDTHCFMLVDESMYSRCRGAALLNVDRRASKPHQAQGDKREQCSSRMRTILRN